MRPGDLPSRDGKEFADSCHSADRPSEETIRSRLIDRRRAFDAAEADRRLLGRMRKRMRPAAGSRRPQLALEAPLAAMRGAARGLSERPIVSFVAVACLSAVILVPLALSALAPLPGEAPAPSALASRSNPAAAHRPSSARTAENGTLGASARSDVAAGRRDTVEADAALAEASIAAALNDTRSSASSASSPSQSGTSGNAGRKTASAYAQPVGPGLPDDASLRRQAARAPWSGPAAAPGGAAPVGARPDVGAETSIAANNMPAIDPAAAALALRLPSGPDEAFTDLDPTATGSIVGSPATTSDVVVPGALTPAASMVVPAPDATSAPIGDFVAVSPSILIASTQAATTPASKAETPRPSLLGETAEPGNAAAGAALPSGETAALPANEGRATASVNLRAEPTNDGTIVAVLAKGEALKILSCQSWCEVETDRGNRGFVYEKFVARTPQE
ncbi:SH3 domain-containing protein [Jiella mangrovi]|uniref:SH3 domain-containing protein n=1 Tax=Jiella mangrovi TaxID=2821407 RepID=A0ABS4BCW4_9HYPH|nr:SH3 domain-containing protein [Jiella mangrovi]MBP0614606.1 SH3 domain-containing protein [Jiella mangrovi]